MMQVYSTSTSIIRSKMWSILALELIYTWNEDTSLYHSIPSSYYSCMLVTTEMKEGISNYSAPLAREPTSSTTHSETSLYRCGTVWSPTVRRWPIALATGLCSLAVRLTCWMLCTLWDPSGLAVTSYHSLTQLAEDTCSWKRTLFFTPTNDIGDLALWQKYIHFSFCHI